jgi:uncharacterized membrane protein
MVIPMNSFETQLDHDRIRRAIAAAEQRTSGELRVVVHQYPAVDALAAAKEEFARLGMHRTRERNAVLIFVAPLSRTFALYGDTGIHAKCGDGFWQEVADAMSGHFKREAYTDGLVHALERAGELLAVHFPRRTDDRNELSDDVVERFPVV